MTLTPNKNLLEEAKAKFSRFRESVVDAMAVLYDVHISKEWQTVADTWGEYVESELQISQGFSSKLLNTYKHFVIEAGVSQEKLMGIDHEKLYLASKTLGTAEEQLARAETLTRGELKLERNENEPHTPHFGEYCDVDGCWLSKANHP